MKFIGQHIVNLIARFRSSIYLEGVKTGTIASGGNLGLDSDNKIVKDSGVGATDLHGAGVDGAANQLLTDDGDGTVTSESGLSYTSDTLSIGDDDADGVTIKRQDHGDGGGGTLHIKGANGTGTNTIGGALKLYGGQGTGTGDGGDIEFHTAADGTSGSSLNGFAYLPRFKIDADGNTTIFGDVNILGTIFTTGDATVFGNDITFEGTTDDTHEVTLSGGNPTSDITVTLPASTGTLALQNEDTTGNANTATTATLASLVYDIGSLTGDVTSSNRVTTIADGSVTETKLDASLLAEIDANTVKTSNVVGDLSFTAISTKLQINTTNGAAISIPAATNTAWGAMSDDLVIALEANTAKPSFPAAVATGNILWKQAKVTLSEAQLTNMHSQAIQLIPAAGANTIIMVGDALALVDRDSSTAQGVASDLCIGYNGTTNYYESILYERRFMYNESGDRTWSLKADYSGEVGASLTAAVNVDVTAAFNVAITSGSLDSVTLYIQYYIIDNS